MTEPAIDPAYLTLIRSDRVSAATRSALLRRADPVPPDHQPVALNPAELATLRAVLARVLPQPGPDRIDLAARLDAALAGGTGDGWRFADLPPDLQACRIGLAALDRLSEPKREFASLDPAAQDAVLALAGSGKAVVPGTWSGQQMLRWFEDVRAEAVKLYVAHPATLARIGYSGIGYGGDGARKPGFHDLEPGTREAWEPVAAADRQP